MYDVARANKLAPDSITYGVLLKGVKLSEDPVMLTKVLDEILGDPSAMQDLRLLSDVLRAISVQHMGPHSVAYPNLLDLYAKYCGSGPAPRS